MRKDGAVEGRKVHVRFAEIVQDHVSQFDPGVRLEAARLFSSADAHLRGDPAPSQLPPEHE